MQNTLGLTTILKDRKSPYLRHV